MIYFFVCRVLVVLLDKIDVELLKVVVEYFFVKLGDFVVVVVGLFFGDGKVSLVVIFSLSVVK